MCHDSCRGWSKSLCREFYTLSSAFLCILKVARHKAKQSVYRNTLFDSPASYYMTLLDKRGEALGQVRRLSAAECEGAAAEGLPWSERASKGSRAEDEPCLPTLALIHTRRP